MTLVKIKVKRMPNSSGLPIPSYQTAGSVGLDLYAAHDLYVTPKPWKVCTGIAVEMPEGYQGQVVPRSGSDFLIWNSPGTIDSDYRGEIVVKVWAPPTHNPIIMCGDRIAQLVIAPVARADLVEVEELSNTDRGSGGFGSTGR